MPHTRAKTPEAFEVCVAARHPAFVGHFVGNPVVPGALLIALIETQFRRWIDPSPVAVSKLRFNHAVLPDQPVHVELTEKESGEWRFRGTVDEQLVIKGIFHITC